MRPSINPNSACDPARVEQYSAEAYDGSDWVEVELLTRLAHATELRDATAGNHLSRVSSMVRAVSLSLGLGRDQAETFGHASVFHDIGKVSVPDSILNRQGSLGKSEFEIVRQHTRVGGDMLQDSRCRIIKVAERIARYHHENWNGTGYEGIHGDWIPLEARITSVADVFDALISERPYKTPWPREEAIMEIGRHAGTRFDPVVVAAFMRVVQRPTPLAA